jgi:hypothetical protein
LRLAGPAARTEVRCAGHTRLDRFAGGRGDLEFGQGAVGAGAREHVGDVGVRAVVAEHGFRDVAARALAQGVEVVAGGGDRVGGVVGVGVAVAVAVDAVGLPGRGRAIGEVELHRSRAAAEGVDTAAHPRRRGAAVV